MERFPTISVVIPSWNQGKYIKRTLLSILRQDYPSKIQVIVSDGGSTDETVSVLKEFGDSIIWWSQKDKGFVDAVMKGCKEATGEIIAIQSSDDYYLPDAFLEMAKAFADNPDAGFVSGGECSIDLAGEIVSSNSFAGPITPESILFKSIPPQHATFIKRSLFEKIGGLREEVDMCADIDLWYRAAHIQQGVYINKYVAVYQLHPDQRTVVSNKWYSSLVRMVETCEKVPLYGNVFCLSLHQKRDLYSYWEMNWTTKRDFSEGRKVAVKKIPRIFNQSFRTNRLLLGILVPGVVKKTASYLKDLFQSNYKSLNPDENIDLSWYK